MIYTFECPHCEKTLFVGDFGLHALEKKIQEFKENNIDKIHLTNIICNICGVKVADSVQKLRSLLKPSSINKVGVLE